MNIEAGNVVWAKMRGYPTWPSVICKDNSTGLFMKGMGSSTKIHVRFLGGDWAPSWLPKSSISEFRRWDTQEDRDNRYRVCPRWEIQHLKAMKAGLRILAKAKHKKTKNEPQKECFPKELMRLTGAQNKTKKTGGKDVTPKRVHAVMEDTQESNGLIKTTRKRSKFKSAGIEKDGQSVVESSLAGRKLTDCALEIDRRSNVNLLDKAKARSDHVIPGNMYDLIKKRKSQTLKTTLSTWPINRNKTNDCIGTIIGSVSKTKKTPVIGDREREQNEIPIRSLSRSESNNNVGNLNNESANRNLVDLHEDLNNVTSVTPNDDTHNNVDNDDVVISIAAKDAVSSETKNISRSKTDANYDSSEEKIEEIPRRETVISAVNVSITRTSTMRINDDMIIQRIQEAYYPSYNIRF